jgi:hypothetical protein
MACSIGSSLMGVLGQGRALFCLRDSNYARERAGFHLVYARIMVSLPPTRHAERSSDPSEQRVAPVNTQPTP